MQRIHILGNRGFIGTNLHRSFSQSGMPVEGNDMPECDLLSPDSIRSAFSAITEEDAIVFASAVTRLTENSFESMLANLRMAENVGRFLEEHPVAQVIFLSTVDVYGLLPDDTAICEDLVPNPDDYYAASKIASEYVLRQRLGRKGILLTVFRLSGIYGPGDEGKSTISALVRSARDKGVITIYGDGANKRDFVYVDDICRLVADAVRRKVEGTFNVATGTSYSVADIAHVIAEAVADDVSIDFQPASPTAEKRTKHMVYDVTHLREVFSRVTLTDVKNGIEKYLAKL